MTARQTELDTLAPSPTALFRFSVVSQVLSRLLGGQQRAQAVGDVVAAEHATPDGELRRVSRRTLQRWLAAYDKKGLAGLEPASRQKTIASTVLPQELLSFLGHEKQIDSRASVPELIRRARELKIISATEPVCRTTVWRACRRMGLATRRRSSKREADMRRFNYPHRMMMVLADGKHFRAGEARQRRVALFYLDDATRYGLAVIVGTSESTELFLHGLYEMIRKVGYCDILYLDHGSGFVSDDTQAVVAQLPFGHLVYGTAGYPEGHGKIERLNQTAKADVLRAVDGAADVDPDCGALTLRLQHYLERQYNLRPHAALAGQSPQQRWHADPRPLRFPRDEDDLSRHFLVTETRRVSRDHVISYGGQLYEVPRPLAASQVEVHRHILSEHLFVPWQGRLVRLHLLDPEANASGGRTAAGEEPSAGEDAVPRTAATIAFDRQWRPIIDADGGYRDPDPAGDDSSATNPPDNDPTNNDRQED